MDRRETADNAAAVHTSAQSDTTVGAVFLLAGVVLGLAALLGQLARRAARSHL